MHASKRETENAGGGNLSVLIPLASQLGKPQEKLWGK